ncbi:MAG TPA: UDP-N-acetylmuramoyl-tripeptide--D-alanyl-D-alanine ligase [Candidatus Krumholzibacteria bacterium]|nr:UDP-N-acetylmuramoyl-tripeptide--D-alanyl-D-alanine ligase [Candidatus Krumholzibacteria bacterium]
MSFTAYDIHEWLDEAEVAHRLLRADGAVWTSENSLASRILHGAVVDSRQSQAAYLFVAMQGERQHGADFLVQSFERGASAALVENKIPGAQGFEQPVFLVEDMHAALFALARGWLHKHPTTVIGITGSNGKTTTKDMAKAALSDREVGVSPGNLNSRIGLPLAVLSQPDQLDFLVLEMGASRKGEIAALSECVRPRIGCVTNVGAAHLENFGDLEGVLVEKSALLQNLPPQGCAVLPGDDANYERLLQASRAGENVSFGKGKKCDVRLQKCQQTAEGLRVKVQGVEVVLPLFGEANGLNAAAACAIAKVAGVEIEDALPRIAEVAVSPHRSRFVRRAGCVILDDCYNANPSSMESALSSLAKLPVKGRKIAILGSMAELGPESTNLHRRVVARAHELGIDELVPVGRQMIFATDEQADPEQNLSALGREIAKGLREGDAVLLKASRSVGLETVLESLLEELSARGGDD